MSEYLIKGETLTSLCDAYRSLLLKTDTSLIGIAALTSFIDMLPIKIYHHNSILSIEEGVLTVDLPKSFFSREKETTIIIKVNNFILSCSSIDMSPLSAEHGSSAGFEIFSNGSPSSSEYLSIYGISGMNKYRVTWNVTDSFNAGVYNGNAELWVVTKS